MKYINKYGVVIPYSKIGYLDDCKKYNYYQKCDLIEKEIFFQLKEL